MYDLTIYQKDLQNKVQSCTRLKIVDLSEIYKIRFKFEYSFNSPFTNVKLLLDSFDTFMIFLMDTYVLRKCTLRT